MQRLLLAMLQLAVTDDDDDDGPPRPAAASGGASSQSRLAMYVKTFKGTVTLFAAVYSVKMFSLRACSQRSLFPPLPPTTHTA